MSTQKPAAPPATDPKAGHNAGYAEPQPQDRDAAQQPHSGKDHDDPEEGGMQRKPEELPGS